MHEGAAIATVKVHKRATRSLNLYIYRIIHMTTNFLLSIYVLWTGAHQFW